MTPRRGRLLGLLLALLAALAAVDGFWIEPRLLLTRDRVAADLIPGSFRIVHLSDLHIERETALYRRLLRKVAAERPDLIVVSGDFVADVHDEAGLREAARAAAGWVSELRRAAPVLAVQGHSDYFGDAVAILAGAGVEWLHNEGRRIGPEQPGGQALLVGLGQYAGRDATAPEPRVFSPVTVAGERVLGARPDGRADHYLSYDPRPPGFDPDRHPDLSTAAGPLAWSGYEAAVSVWVDREETGAGLAVHCRHVLGEDRLIRFARARGHRRAERGGRAGDSGTFALSFNGTAATAGEADSGVAPEPGRWYRLRVRTEVAPGRVVVRGRAWPEGEPEPTGWQAWLEDRSPYRVEAGTVALWAWSDGGGDGTAAFRDLRVVGGGGRALLETGLAGPGVAGGGQQAWGTGLGGLPAGFRAGARASRLALALSRSPELPAGTPRIVLSHTPDAVEEAARRGIDLVLAGHTHGGQVRLPFVGALTTRSAIGRRYDRGLFTWPAPTPGRREGDTLLYVNAGVGTSILPVRFFDPPVYAVIDL